VEINGMAHVFLTVSDYTACRAFYGGLLPALGMTPVIDADGMYYCVGGRTAVGISRGDSAYRDERFVQTRVGLHHLCFRARERADVDEVHELAKRLGARIVHPPQEDGFAPGYYSVLFEDPDGIRLEVNHVPGKGLLEKPPGA
jgi:catechol 2,3-dioxygenase-like lactoylglutathione lyase family enzyme